ncbi:MarR family winged helix-turn-helix transcriptional regulator [Thermomonospora catenispora]|uniref:MarR family winged helix-turn-helix transcriptional regulator n=1 Tax=Thermomonospora catenispora TaxID=2493090 RepID=UPI00111DB0B6|nr:MarR family transcriptional regulator [Thermomonospora catenispora]TNY38104.1 MarR family transcriptional regulator [Thermomonospora catenispora]
MAPHDPIDELLAQWSWAAYDLPLAEMAVAERITRLARRLERLTADTLGAYGLEPGEFDVIAALLRAGPPHELTPTVLHRSLMISGGGLTKRLNRLERRGLITRRLASGDRRCLPVALTDTGRRLAEQAVTAHARAIAELIGTLPAERRERLSALLRELLVNAERALGDRPRPDGAPVRRPSPAPRSPAGDLV